MMRFAAAIGKAPGPKIHIMGVHWAPKLKNGQKPRGKIKKTVVLIWAPKLKNGQKPRPLRFATATHVFQLDEVFFQGATMPHPPRVDVNNG